MIEREFFVPFFYAGERKIGGNAPCFIIAEAGVSHFGDVQKAYQLVDMAVQAKADAVKFQIFRTSSLISSQNSEWTERMQCKELTIDQFQSIQEYANDAGILFFATAHDLESLDALSTLNPPLYKIGSGEVSNPEFFRAVAKKGKPIVFSTGMYTQKELEQSLSALQQEGARQVAVMHCVTSYPTPPEDVNLKVISTLRELFLGPVGYSDHCATHDIAAASVMLGASIIEKHITLEKNIPNAQDWKVACDPEELVEFVSSVRRLEAALGSKEMLRTLNEEKSLLWARKSIVAKHDLSAGTILRREDLTFKRPGNGISPERLNEILGASLNVNVSADTLITLEMIGHTVTPQE